MSLIARVYGATFSLVKYLLFAYFVLAMKIKILQLLSSKLLYNVTV